MASASPNKSVISRAAAILTTGEVAGVILTLNEAWGSKVCTELSFTLGSLTNISVRAYASNDGTNWFQIGTTDVVTANASKAYVHELPGYRFFRVSVQGSGTVTSSSAALTHRYLRRGSQ